MEILENLGVSSTVWPGEGGGEIGGTEEVGGNGMAESGEKVLRCRALVGIFVIEGLWNCAVRLGRDDDDLHLT